MAKLHDSHNEIYESWKMVSLLNQGIDAKLTQLCQKWKLCRPFVDFGWFANEPLASLFQDIID